MNYIIEFDIAGLILSLTIGFVIFLRRYFPTKARNYFRQTVVILTLSSLLNLVTVFTIDSNNVSVIPVWANYILFIAYYSMINSLAASAFYFIAYSIILKKDTPKILDNEILTEYGYLPWIISEALITTTPLTKFVIYFDADKVYHYSTLLPMPYIMAALYLTLSILIAIKNKDAFSKRQLGSILLYIIAVALSAVFQFLTKRYLVIEFISSVTVMLVFLSLDNPAQFIDSETSLFNTKAFNAIVMQKTTETNRKKFRIIGFCIPEIQEIAPVFGFENHSAVMILIQKTLRQNIKVKYIFRLSTVNFAVLIDDNIKQEDMIISKLQSCFSKPFKVSDYLIQLTVRISTLKCPRDSTNLEDITELLTFNLEKMKTQENGFVQQVDNSILNAKQRETKILMMLRKAVMNKQFYVVYQPIFNMEKQRFTTAEALVRLADEELGCLSPEEFIPIAEKNGMVLEIGNFVFKSVCKFLANERPWEKGIEYIHINLSVIQCMQEKLSVQLISIMKSYKIDCKYINFEVTETSAIISSELLRVNMTELKKSNITFSLDDFGSGFSNTSSLIKYPYSSIKLDKSLIQRAKENQKAYDILKYTIELIKSLNMKVVSEGIETEEDNKIVTELGTDFIQGYYYSKPLTEDKFLELISR